MADDLDRCRECYAYVESTTRHRNWHHEQNQKLQALEQQIQRLQRG